MNIPDKVKVGGYWYEIRKGYQFTEQADLLGQADHDGLVIRLSDKDATGRDMPEQKKEEVFIHEILHCIDAVYNSAKLDEEIVERIAEGLYQVLKDMEVI